MVDRNSKRVMNRPAVVINSHLNSLAIESSFFRPIANCHGTPVECDPSCSAAVTLLFYVCRPSHVARLVISVIVNAVKAVLWRWRIADILEKVFKRALPTTTDRYSTTTVSSVAPICGRVASGAHPTPGSILLRLIAHRVTMLIRRIFLSWQPFAPTAAPAASGSSCSKTTTPNSSLSTAVATANPPSTTMFPVFWCCRLSKDSPLTEAPSYQVVFHRSPLWLRVYAKQS